MGYYSHYCLTWTNNHTELTNEEIAKKVYDILIKRDEFSDEDWAMSDSIENDLEDMISSDIRKWYDCKEDMLEVSRQLPDITFLISGDGEDRDDTWQEYYRNGKSEYCQGIVHYPTPSDFFLKGEN